MENAVYGAIIFVGVWAVLVFSISDNASINVVEAQNMSYQAEMKGHEFKEGMWGE